MNIIAWTLIVICVINTLGVPLLFGQTRGVYDYRFFMSTVLSSIMVILVSGRVLGWF